jgi:hypothetical protein
MKKKFALLFATILLLTVSVYAQNPQLNGKWILESASVIQDDNGNETKLNLDEAKKIISFRFYDELIFSEEQLILVFDETSFDGQATITSNLIQIDAAPASLFFTWKVKRGRLYLEHKHTERSLNKANVNYKISSVYIKQ